MIRRCVQRERLLKTDLSLEKHLQPRLEVAEKYCLVLEAKRCFFMRYCVSAVILWPL